MSQSHPTNAWRQLESMATDSSQISIPALLSNPTRLERYSCSLNGLYVDFSKHLVTDEVFDHLLRLAEESGVSERATKMHEGDTVNVTENRSVLHMAMRGKNSGNPEQDRMKDISDAIRSGQWTGATGEKITDVINIGIGGSDLGPKMVCTALREFTDGPRCHFISNVDGAEIRSLTDQLSADSTLIIVSSKTFTTSETMLNTRTALSWLGTELDLENPAASRHCIGITNHPDKAKAFGLHEERILTFSEAIGGRYSLWSAIGLPICIATGYARFEELLSGAQAMDSHFLDAPAASNMPVILALLGIWYNNFLKLHSHAVIPYCQRLRLFVDHLQQLDMESSGKSASLNGEAVAIETGPVVWGQTGTNGQHAFFQLLHQGTQVVPVDFIGLVNDRLSSTEHHQMLIANMIAQSEALMKGRESEDQHRNYAGNRPSTTLLLDELTPYNLGMLIALYEHKVFVQGTIWNINSFDQWGVELGKELANTILSGSKESHDPSTLSLMKRTGLID